MQTSSPPRNPGGRPPVSRDSEVLNVIVPKELMARVRKLSEERGSTIAWIVRRALSEMMDREGYR